MLLGAGAAVDAPAKDGSTALHKAAFKGHTAVVQLLLNAGASVHAVCHPDWTALQWTAQEGHTKVVQLLLNAGADINSAAPEPAWRMAWGTGTWGLWLCSTAVVLAAKSGHAATVQVLLAVPEVATRALI
jgi:ankyrin repeat protein